MRKSFIFDILAIVLIGTSSCTQTKIVDATSWQITDCNIGYSQWRYSGDDTGTKYDNNYYYAAYNLSQLTKDIFNDGNVQVYLVEKNSYGEDTQRPLPFTRHYETWKGEQTLFHTETYDYFYGIGWIEFNYTASDFAYEDSQGADYHPGATQFRVVFTW